MPSTLNTTFEWPTNFSNGTAITGIGTLLQYSNHVTNGMFAIGILLIIFLMGLVGGMMVGIKKSLASSSFITFVFAVYFWRIDMVPDIVLYGLLFLMIVGVIGSKGESNSM